MDDFFSTVKKGLLFGVPTVIIASIIFQIADFLDGLGSMVYEFENSIWIYPWLILWLVGFFVMKLNKRVEWKKRSSSVLAKIIGRIDEWLVKRPIVGVLLQVLKAILGLDKEKGHGVFDDPIYVKIADGVYELGNL